MVIPVPVQSKDIIKAHLLCLNPFMKLKPRELQLLDAMLKVYFNLKRAAGKGQITEKEIDERLVDPMGRKVTRDLINMTEASHNNHFVQLKKKKVITEDGKLQDFLKNLDSGDMTINYKLKVVKEPKIVAPKDVPETTTA